MTGVTAGVGVTGFVTESIVGVAVVAAIVGVSGVSGVVGTKLSNSLCLQRV